MWVLSSFLYADEKSLFSMSVVLTLFLSRCSFTFLFQWLECVFWIRVQRFYNTKKFSLTEFEYGRRKKCLKISVFPTQTCSLRCWLLLGVFKEKRKRNKKYGQSISIMCVIFDKSIDHFTRFKNHLNKHYSDVQWREMFDSIIANIAGGCIFRRAEQQLRNTLGRTTRSTTTVSFVSDAFVTANTMKYIYWLFYDPDTRLERDFSTFYPHSVVRYDVSDEKLMYGERSDKNVETLNVWTTFILLYCFWKIINTKVYKCIFFIRLTSTVRRYTVIFI